MSEVADTIWRQISVQTKMAVGARSPYADDDSVTFKVHSKPRRYIIVALTPRDTYRVRHMRLDRRNRPVELGTHEDVYVDTLNEVIYRLVHDAKG